MTELEPKSTVETPDLDARAESRSRRFVQICGVIFVILLGLIAFTVWSVIPSIERDPAAVRETMRELAGDLAIPAGFEPSEAIKVSPMGFVSGRTAKFVGPKADTYLTASVYKGAEELPRNAVIALDDETTDEAVIGGESRTIHLGNLPKPANLPPAQKNGPTLRCGWVWTNSRDGVLVVSLIGPAADFDDKKAIAMLRTVDPPTK